MTRPLHATLLEFSCFTTYYNTISSQLLRNTIKTAILKMNSETCIHVSLYWIYWTQMPKSGRWTWPHIKPRTA